MSADISLERGAGAPISRYSQLLSPLPAGIPNNTDKDIDLSRSTISDSGGNIYD